MRRKLVKGLALDGLGAAEGDTDGNGSQAFDDLLERDNGQPLRELLHFFNDAVSAPDQPLAALFHAQITEEFITIEADDEPPTSR